MPNETNKVWVGNNAAFHNVGMGAVNFGTGSTQDNTGTLGLKQVTFGASTVAKLPSAALNKFAVTFVTDATATTFASTVAGGGSNTVPVWSDGTNWKIG